MSDSRDKIARDIKKFAGNVGLNEIYVTFEENRSHGHTIFVSLMNATETHFGIREIKRYLSSRWKEYNIILVLNPIIDDFNEALKRFKDKHYFSNREVSVKVSAHRLGIHPDALSA